MSYWRPRKGFYCDARTSGSGLEGLLLTFSIMGPSTEILAKGVAMDLGMRSVSHGCFSRSADVGRSLGFLDRQLILLGRMGPVQTCGLLS